MPTFNGERYIAAALASLRQPDGYPEEVIIVDDGSTDRTLDIAAGFSSQLPLRILRPGRRGNWLAMTNIGLSEAHCPWSSILHQDDVWAPGRLAHLRSHLDSEAKLLVMDSQFIDASDRKLGPWRIPRTVRADAIRAPEHIAAALYVQNWIAVPSVTARTAAILQSGGLDESLWYTADWDLWLRLSRDVPMRVVAHIGSSFRVHGESQTVKGSVDLAAFRDQMTTVQSRHDWAASLSQKPSLLRRAGRLSTETNVMLAGLMHSGTGVVPPWMKELRLAGPAGALTFYRNSAIASRLLARLVLQIRR